MSYLDEVYKFLNILGHHRFRVLVKLLFIVLLLVLILASCMLFLPENIRESLQLSAFMSGEYGQFAGIALIASFFGIICYALYIKIIPTDNEKQTLIDNITQISQYLLMSDWDVFISNAGRRHIRKEFVYNVNGYNDFVTSAIWPKRYENVKKLVFNINEVYQKFWEIFNMHSELINDEYFHEVQFYKIKTYNENYNEDAERFNQWSWKWYCTLDYLVILLNRYIDLINKELKYENVPELYKKKYKNLIEDLGICEEKYLRTLETLGLKQKIEIRQSVAKPVPLVGVLLAIAVIAALTSLSVPHFKAASARAKAAEPPRVIGSYESSQLADYVRDGRVEVTRVGELVGDTAVVGGSK
jgi:hypothetical protein